MFEETLPENVKCGIVEILGGKTGWINDGEARVLLIDDVLLNQFHTYSP